MVATKHWDASTASWILVGGMSTLTNALPVHGGKMTGPLRVTRDLMTLGVAHADYYANSNPNAYLDASIKLTGRTVRFGGHPVKHVGTPTSASDLATNNYLNTTSTTGSERHPLPMYLHWAVNADEDHALTAHRSRDGLVTVQGVIALNIPPGARSDFTLISVLPEDMRPSTVKLFPLFVDGTVHRCEIHPDGDIRLIHGAASIPAGSRVVISGVCFYQE